jgi:hypothetical protein
MCQITQININTRNSADSTSSIDNIFLDRSRNKNFIIEPYYNAVSDHDALTLTLSNPSHKPPKSGRVRIGKYYDDSSIREFN